MKFYIQVFIDFKKLGNYPKIRCNGQDLTFIFWNLVWSIMVKTSLRQAAIFVIHFSFFISPRVGVSDIRVFLWFVDQAVKNIICSITPFSLRGNWSIKSNQNLHASRTSFRTSLYMQDLNVTPVPGNQLFIESWIWNEVWSMVIRCYWVTNQDWTG